MDCPPLERLGKFSCILADPPWAFRTYGGDKTTPHRSAEDHYLTVDTVDLKKFPVETVADKDCCLFMWIVDSHLEESLSLGMAWGFEFKTIAFIWDKGKISLGYWTRKEAEICLLFTRGKPKRISKGVRQIIREAPREHSRKPDCQYHRIEDLVSGPYLELFGRQARPKWITWGNQAGLFDGRGLPSDRDYGPLLTAADVNVVHNA